MSEPDPRALLAPEMTYEQKREAGRLAERRAFATCPVGTRVRFQIRPDRIVFTPGPREGVGVVTVIWSAMGEPTWDVRVEPTYEEALWGDVQPVTVCVNPDFGDLIEPTHAGASPDE